MGHLAIDETHCTMPLGYVPIVTTLLLLSMRANLLMSGYPLKDVSIDVPATQDGHARKRHISVFSSILYPLSFSSSCPFHCILSSFHLLLWQDSIIRRTFFQAVPLVGQYCHRFLCHFGLLAGHQHSAILNQTGPLAGHRQLVHISRVAGYPFPSSKWAIPVHTPP